MVHVVEFYVQQSTLVFMTLLLPCISWYIALSGVLEFQNTERNKIKKQLFVNLGGVKCFLYFCIRFVRRTITNVCSDVLLSLVSLHEVGPMKGYDCRLRYYLFLTSETGENTYINVSFKDDVTVVQ